MWSANATILTWLALAALLAAITREDLRSHRIPNRANAVLLIGGLAISAATGRPDLLDALGGVALGGAFLAATAVLYRRARGIDGLGFGDVKFLAAAGTWVGWQGIGPLVCLAATAALVVVAGQRLRGRTVDRRTAIPFGPYLCGALIAVRAIQSTDLGLG